MFIRITLRKVLRAEKIVAGTVCYVEQFTGADIRVHATLYARADVDWLWRACRASQPELNRRCHLILNIQDFSIVLAARDYNPTMVNPELLRGNGVVPGDWELSRPPVVSSQAVQIIFKNGIKIEAQPGSISFSQGIDTDSFKNIELPRLARRYAVTLPNLA